jgi:hypothetical protein
MEAFDIPWGRDTDLHRRGVRTYFEAAAPLNPSLFRHVHQVVLVQVVPDGHSPDVHTAGLMPAAILGCRSGSSEVGAHLDTVRLADPRPALCRNGRAMK